MERPSRLSLDLLRTNNCYYQDIGVPDRLLVVFGYADQPFGVRAHERFLGRSCNKLFLHSGASDWFQNGIPPIAGSFSELMEFFADIRDHFSEKEILFTGQSMGAFGALACGIAAASPRILVSVPEVRLLGEGSRSSKYLQERDVSFASIEHILETNQSSEITVLVGVQDKFDMAVSEYLLSLNRCDVILLDCDHYTLPYLRDKGVLENVFENFVRAKSVRDAIAASSIDC